MDGSNIFGEGVMLANIERKKAYDEAVKDCIKEIEDTIRKVETHYWEGDTITEILETVIIRFKNKLTKEM